MPENTAPKSLAQRLAAQIAEATAIAMKEAQAQYGPAQAELDDANADLVRAEARVALAATNVRELQDLLGGIPNDDIVMTQAEVESHNDEAAFDERVDPMVFGYSRINSPAPTSAD